MTLPDVEIRVPASLIVLLLGTVQACERPHDAQQVATRPSVESRAREVVGALKARDAARLASLVHSAKGVRFTPYPFVRVDRDVVLTRDQVERAFTDTTRRTWGTADGSGEPITLPFEQYHRRFVYDVDFAAAPMVRANLPPAKPGNTPSNIAEAYPGAEWVEFHFPAIDAQFEGMDWRSLWLVFERDGSDWMLTGIVHGSWTI